MYVDEIGPDIVDGIHLAQDTCQWQAAVNTAINLQIPEKAGNLLTSLSTTSFSRSNAFNEVTYWQPCVGQPCYRQESNSFTYDS